jgi:hypothetical protein
MTVETLPLRARARRLFGTGHVAEVVPLKSSASARFNACLKAGDNAADPDMRRVWHNHAQAVWHGAASEWPYVPPYTGADFELDGVMRSRPRAQRSWLPDWPAGIWLTGVLIFCAGFWFGAIALVLYIGEAMD